MRGEARGAGGGGGSGGAAAAVAAKTSRPGYRMSRQLEGIKAAFQI